MQRALGAFCLLLLPLVSASSGQDAPPVIVAEVVEAEVHIGYRVVGTVAPLRTATIGSGVAGRVDEFLVDVGQPVEEGQPVARLRTQTLEIERAAALAELDLFAQQLAELENGSRVEEIEEAEALASGAEAAMKNADAQLKRLQVLSASRAATDADLENAQERANFTQFALRAAEARLASVRRGPRQEQIAQAKARLELQRQNVRLIEDRIQKHTLFAPFDGFVAAEYTEIGAWISSGDPVVQVIQLDEVEIQAPVTAESATKLRRGDTIRVEFPELPDKLLTGSVHRIVPIADPRSRTFPVHVRLKNEFRDEAPLLMAGMLARLDLPAGQRQAMPLVPKDALVLNDRERAVFVVDLEPSQNGSERIGTVRKVPVELGVATEDRIQVSGDLNAGQLVVIYGNERLVSGTRVSLVDP